MANTISAIAINGRNVSTYTDVLDMDSGLIAATTAAGGQVLQADFRGHKMPVVSDATLPTVVAEAGAKPAVDATVNVAALNVEMYAKFRPVSRQLEQTTDPANLVTEIVSSAAALFPTAFDVRHLNVLYAGANKFADVEYDAANPIASLSSWLSSYDETSFAADAAILTRQGARKLGYALDSQNRLQASNGVQSLLPVPSFLTGATGTQIGAATVMGVIGPFRASVVARNIGLGIERMTQATVNGAGPEQNINNYRVESALGYVNGIDYDATGRGFRFLIDAVSP